MRGNELGLSVWAERPCGVKRASRIDNFDVKCAVKVNSMAMIRSILRVRAGGGHGVVSEGPSSCALDWSH